MMRSRLNASLPLMLASAAAMNGGFTASLPPIGLNLSKGRTQRAYGQSLAERIRTATSLDHLLALSDTAKSYRGASMATKRKWHKLAMQRREELVQAAVEAED